MPSATLAFVLASVVSVLACRGEDSAHARGAAGGGGVAIIEEPREGYAAQVVADAGTITGVVGYSGPAPEDTSVAVGRDQRVCGEVIRHGGVESVADRLPGALVWISDIRRGRPLPLAKRFELVQERCMFSPRVQAVIAGGALNVRTHDPIVNRSAVVDMRTLDTLVVLPFTDAGVVIPLGVPLQRPAMLHVRSTTHPWMEAWVAVLDHPYFAQTDESGAFSIEGVPAGQYEVRAWHPAFGLERARHTVRPGAASPVRITFDNSSHREAAP